MKLENEFTVPVPVEDAWKVLLDVERVAPCMPGATLLTVDGDDFTGTVKVKVGPIQVTYRGKARFASRDDATHTAVIEASGKEARGSGTAAATVTTSLYDNGDTTRVRVETDLNITGRPAQFGRGVMSEVAAKLIDQFAACLAEEVRGGGAAPAPEQTPVAAAAVEETQPLTTGPAPTLPPTSTAPVEAAPAPATPLPASEAATATSGGPTRIEPAPRRTAEAIDLLETAGLPVAKRLAPVAAVVALVLFVLWWRRRR